jgi:hypothetical protein
MKLRSLPGDAGITSKRRVVGAKLFYLTGEGGSICGFSRFRLPLLGAGSWMRRAPAKDHRSYAHRVQSD